MKALLVSPDTHSIEAIDITDYDQIAKLTPFDTIISDEIGSAGDRLYFDEECFLRGTTGRFQIDTLIPVSGKGVIVGTADDGKSLRDVAMGIGDLRHRIKFL